MRKFLLVAGLLASMAVYAEGNKVEVRGGIDLNPTFNVGNGLNKDSKFSYELGVEYRKELPYNFELGVGIAYQDHGKSKSKTINGVKIESDFYDSIPLYVTGRYNFKNSTEVIPYLKLNLGYSLNVNDGSVEEKYPLGNTYSSDFNAKNGFYYAAGAGLEFRGFTLDLMYQRNYSDAELEFNGVKYSEGSADFDRVTLGFGYNFGF